MIGDDFAPSCVEPFTLGAARDARFDITHGEMMQSSIGEELKNLKRAGCR
jgi:hypothetical protein